MAEAWRVLVTDSGYKHALAIVRDLGARCEVDTCGPRRLAMAGVSRWTRRDLRAPSPTDGARFLSWLDGAVSRYRYDQIIPVGYAACGLLSEHLTRWSPRTTVVLPPAEAVHRALDKRAMNALAGAVGVPAPRTAQPATVAELAAAADEVGFPLVIKAPLEGQGDVAYVDRPGDLAARYRAYLDRNGWTSPSLPILQQRISGPGFGVFATYQDGRLRRIMAHRRVREFPPTGGPSTCAELVDDPALLAAGRSVLDALAWHGVAMVEFKRHEADGRYYLMEVNPKFWGSLDLALAAGCDFPADLVDIARGADLPDRPPPAGPLRLCWPLSGDLRYLAARPRAWPQVLRDWFDPEVRTNLRWSDPLPHLVEVAETAGAIARRR